MRHKLLIVCLLFVAASALAAGRQYYDYPDALPVRDSDRLLIYQSASGSRNLTGAGLKRAINRTILQTGQPLVKQAFDNQTSSGTIAWAVKDGYGVIRRITKSNGWEMFGAPPLVPYYVYPYDGMTGVSTNTPLVLALNFVARGFDRRYITIEGTGTTIQALTYVGSGNFDYLAYGQADQTRLDSWLWGTGQTALQPDTTYTIRWTNRGHPWQSGQSDITCGGVMRNVSSGGICKSTFRTGSGP